MEKSLNDDNRSRGKKGEGLFLAKFIESKQTTTSAVVLLLGDKALI